MWVHRGPDTADDRLTHLDQDVALPDLGVVEDDGDTLLQFGQ